MEKNDDNRREIKGVSTDMEFKDQELEFLKLASSLAKEYQKVYDEKKAETLAGKDTFVKQK